MFQFPPNPTPGQTITQVAGVTYRWSGTAWHLIAGPGSFITQADADTRYVNVDEVSNTTNRIINGKFQFAQMTNGTVDAVSPTNSYFADRWQCGSNGGGRYYAQILPLTDPAVADVYESVFRLTPVTLMPSPAGASYAFISQAIEGINCRDFFSGTSQARTITLAFDIKVNSAIGTHYVAFRNGAANRSYPASYTVNAANTWETKVITIPCDTTGVWATDNTVGMIVFFTFAAGPTLVAPAANAWQSGNFVSGPGGVNWMAGAGEVYLKNCRLYKGSVDYGPDRRLYAEELALCQRYYEKSYPQGTVPGAAIQTGCTQFNQPVAASSPAYLPAVRFMVEKRAVPTITIYSPGVASSNQIYNFALPVSFTGSGVQEPDATGFTVLGTTPAGSTVGQHCGYHWSASAEL